MKGGLALALALTGVAAGPVLEGYDMVSYWSLGDGDDGVQGSKEFAHNLTTQDYVTGAELGPFEFWFASAENLATFAADPWKYAPRWGGF